VSDQPITEELTKELLRRLYALDKPINRLSDVASELEQGELRTELVRAIGDIMRDVTFELIAPLYRFYPHLGNFAEPGEWIHDSDIDANRRA
jgi:hypothetical protein